MFHKRSKMWRASAGASVVVVLMLLVAVHAYVNRSDYSAEPFWIYDSNLTVGHVETANLNNDGTPDIIAGEYSSDYYGEPSRVYGIDGATGDTLWSYLLQDGVRSMTAGDLNGDGITDAVAGAAYNASGTPDGKVHAINGTDGTAFWTYPLNKSVNAVVIADLNGDAILDVVAGQLGDRIYAIDGATGGFLWSKLISSLWINALSAGDVNGDNIDDIAFAHEYLAGFDNHFGVIDGASGAYIYDSIVDYISFDALLADIDNDGVLEAVFGCVYGDNHGEIFVRNAADGALEWSYNIGPVDHTNGNILLYAVDLDEDSDLDLVIGTYLGDRLIFAFDGETNVVTWVSDTLDANTRDMAFGDVLGDKDMNIVVAGSDRVEVVNGLDGSKVYYYAVNGAMYSVCVADFDGDEILDFAAGGSADASGTPPNPDKGVWALHSTLSPVLWEYDIGEYGNSLALGDFNGDGCQDAVAVCSVEDHAVGINGVDGTQLWVWQGTQNLYAATTGDFNGDGFDDAAVGGYDEMVTAINGTDGTVLWQFTAPTDQIYRKCIKAADLNDDTFIDVIVGADDNMVYAINGTNGAELWNQYVGGEVSEIDLAQMNNTGPLDVVVAVGSGPDGENVTVLDGSDGSVFWRYTAPANVEHIEPMDVNEDNIMDVAAGIAPYSRQVIMINGASQTAIWTMPVDVESNIHDMGGGDLNGDKTPDVLVPATLGTSDGVIALSGDDGHVLWEFPTGAEVNDALVYDVDNDGENEGILGADDNNVYVIDGALGTVEWNYSTAGDVMHVAVGDIDCNDRVNIVCVLFGSQGLVYGFRTLDNTQHFICGDANDDGGVNVADAVFLINYVFKGGPAPDPVCVGDANGDGGTNVADAVYLINYVFKGGPPPVDDCC